MGSLKRTDPDCRNRRTHSLADQTTPSLVVDSIAFIMYSKKWWLTPIVVALLLLSLIASLSGTGVAPLIYTLF